MKTTWFETFVRLVFGHFFHALIHPYYERITMSMSALEARLTALNTQLAKVGTEINGKLDELRDALEAAGQVPAEVSAILDEIQTSVDALDSIVPDVEVPVDPVDPDAP